MPKPLTTLLTALVLILAAAPAGADCSKRAMADVYAWISYDLDDGENRVYNKRAHLETITRNGYYGGGCKTAVGRQKARRRACRKAYEESRALYRGDLDRHKRMVCQSRIPQKGTKEGKMIPLADLKVKWVRIDRMYVYVWAQDNTVCAEQFRKAKIHSTSERFTCPRPSLPAPGSLPTRLKQ